VQKKNISKKIDISCQPLLMLIVAFSSVVAVMKDERTTYLVRDRRIWWIDEGVVNVQIQRPVMLSYLWECCCAREEERADDTPRESHEVLESEGHKAGRFTASWL
jgi:hypothetical protein